MLGDRAHAVVVGGGVVGCFTAYNLARAGIRVTLLERGPVCAEASSAAAGLAAISTRDGFLLELARRSLQMLHQTDEEMGGSMEVKANGTLTLLRTEEEYAKQAAHVERQRSRGIEIELLDRQAAREIEPLVSPEILGAVYSPVDSTANPFAMTLALAAAARRLGATIRTGTEVTALREEGGRVRAAVTADGEVAGDVVVLAAGAWSPLLARTLGIEIPVEPARGQVLATEPVPLHRATVKDTGHIYICPTRRGNYAIGSVTEKVGFNKQLTAERLHEYAREAIGLVPAFRGVGMIRAWAGLRPLSPDNLPLLGEVPGHEGLVLATGHSRLGILLSAATCKIVSDLITGTVPEFPLEPFSPTRFGTGTG